MNAIDKRLGRLLKLACLLMFVSSPGVAVSQQKSMSIEELEAYIAEQKSALEQVKANREETARKADEVRKELAEQESRMARVEEELETLCQQHESLQEGSYDDCRRDH